MAVKDEQGRVRTVVKQNPGSIIVLAAIDRTIHGKVATGSNVIQNMQVTAACRSTQAK